MRKHLSEPGAIDATDNEVGASKHQGFGQARRPPLLRAFGPRSVCGSP